MKTDIPSVHIDWFIANASTPPLYHDLLSLPLTDRDLETRLEVDVARNLVNAPGVRVWRAGFNNSGVSTNNRVVERHTSRYGAYWKSYDFAGSVGTQNIFTHPLNFTHDGGEVVFNLPNGLQGYYLANASGFRLDDAPINIVSNPAASDPTVRNGISCIGCHTEGMKTFEDEVRFAIESNPNPAYNKAQALRLYVEKSVMDAHVEKDMEKYRAALEATGGVFGGVEPVSRFHEAFQAPVDAAYAAAVVGLQTETFLERVRENTGLQNVGLLVLDSENGSVKRDTWTSSFRDVMYALDYPGQVGEIPVVSQPELLPGSVIRFPDLNLHAAVAKALGINPNSPITVTAMESLERLDVHKSGIVDLTGIQYARNLSELHLNDNEISDLSLVANLNKLNILRFDHTPVSDLSPLKDLISLTVLSFSWTQVSDLSPLTGLLNLKRVYFHDTRVSDLSPLARLTDLDRVWFAATTISDLSPLAGLTNLEFLFSWGNPISDLSPLANLKNLWHIDICGAKLSDLSVLTGLSNLKNLYLGGNGITDISQLAELTNGLNRLNLRDNNISDISQLARSTHLEWLDVSRNEIVDFSPLTELRENTNIVWHSNPGFPKGGPKIEGPWLWVVLPDTSLERDTDMLAEASGGTLTEVEVATHGATVGKPFGGNEWAPYTISTTGTKNIRDMLGNTVPDGVIYGTINLYSPQEQETTMYVGSEREVKVWLNGELVYQRFHHWNADNYNDFYPVTLEQGKNVVLVAVSTFSNGFFGFERGTDYMVSTGVGYAFSEMPVHVGDTFTFDVRAENVSDLAGWQLDVVFDPTALEAIEISEGDFLKTDGGATFFQSGNIDNTAGKITELKSALLSDHGVSGSGSLLEVRFKAKSDG